MPNKNAEHIKQLEKIRIHVDDYICDDDALDAIDAAIAALRNEGRSPWRKATPAKLNKYGGKLVWVAWEDGEMTYTQVPAKYLGIKRWGSLFHGRALYLCDNKPAHPEKGKVK